MEDVATSSAWTRAAGALLALGWIVFWCGALNPLAYRLWGSGATLEEFLAIIAEQPGGWRAIAVAFAAGALATLFGFTLLGEALRDGRGAGWAVLGRTALTVGVVLWLASLAFRGTVTVFAAETLRDTGVLPAWYPPLRDGSGALFAVYMILAYLALAAYGAGLRASALAPRWGVALAIFGVVAAAGFAAGVGPFSPPLMVHPLPGLLGLWLLARRVGEA